MTNLNEHPRHLSKDLEQLKGRKVFIFGDVGIDEYVRGDVTRISPEAPVPVVDVKESEKKLGLSANVAANVLSLGGEPLLFSLVGEDNHAEHLRQLLKDRGIATDHLMTDSQRKTTTKLRVMSGQHHVVRVDFESRSPVTSETLKAYAKPIEQGIEESDVVIIQDYAKGQVGEESAQQVIHWAQKHNKKVLVDPYRSTPLQTYRGASFMTPNRDEALELAKQVPQPEIWHDVDQIGRALMEQLGSPQMVITLGPEGVKIFSDNQVSHLPTFARKVFDVTGAGDTVIAAFSLGVAAGWDLHKSAFLANMAAGVVVGHVGAVACDLNELRAYLQNH
jgi:rfaE bifunctional protein kinase chain/domain